MSMLAERRRKKKWALLPKSSPRKPIWATDDENMKFGQKLMEKMGWSAGKGLGANEQGIQEPLRVSYKNDTKGMGYKLNEDEWISQQDEFNDLLTQLSGITDSTSLTEVHKTGIGSLEKKSKELKNRVHYQKFTRGKDLSRYSENDLACILGTNKLKVVNNQEKKIVPEENSKEDNKNMEAGFKTINGGSLVDYFKIKLSAINMKSNKQSLGKDESIENCSDSKSGFEYHPAEEQVHSNETFDKKTNEKGKKESKMHKRRHSLLENVENQFCNSGNIKECVDYKSKKTKKNSDSFIGDINDNIKIKEKSATEKEENDCTDTANEKSLKKSKKQNNKGSLILSEKLYDCEEEVNDCKENKKSEDFMQPKLITDETGDQCMVEVENSLKKEAIKKKKKEKKGDDGHDLAIDKTSISMLEVEQQSVSNEPIKKKKKKQSKHSTSQTSDKSFIEEVKKKNKHFYTDEIENEKHSSKKRKKDKCKRDNINEDINEQLLCDSFVNNKTEPVSHKSGVDANSENIIEVKKKKKKERKEKYDESIDHEEENDNLCDLKNESGSDQEKEKKSKKVKRKHESELVVVKKKKTKDDKSRNSSVNYDVRESKNIIESVTNSEDSNVIHTHKISLFKKKLPPYEGHKFSSIAALKLIGGVQIDRFAGSNLGNLEGYGNIIKRQTNHSVTTSR